MRLTPLLTSLLLLFSLGTSASERIFPIWGDLAEERGMKLPLTYGVGLAVMPMRQDYLIERLDIEFADGSSLPVTPDQLDIVDVSGESLNHSLRFDMWLFPFLNIYGILGYTDGSTDTIINIPPGSIPGFGSQVNFRMEYEGPSNGAGMTLAYGKGSWFITLDHNFTDSDLSVADSTITANVTTLRTGLLFETKNFGRGSAWIGSMHQDVDQTIAGTVDFLPGLPPVNYKVIESAADEYNMVMGTSLEISRHWYATFEAGFRGRTQTLATLLYRF